MDCDATHHSTNGRGWDVRGGLGSACELPCTTTGRGQAPEARTEAVQERSPPHHHRAGLAPIGANLSVSMSGCPTPPQGGGKPHKRFTSDGPAPPQGGGKPHKREPKGKGMEPCGRVQERKQSLMTRNGGPNAKPHVRR